MRERLEREQRLVLLLLVHCEVKVLVRLLRLGGHQQVRHGGRTDSCSAGGSSLELATKFEEVPKICDFISL